MPGRENGFPEKFKSVWKAQKGTKAELQGAVRWGGWLTWDGSFPVKNIAKNANAV